MSLTRFGRFAMQVLTMVMVVAMLGLIVLFATAGELGKRASKTAPQAGDVDHLTASETSTASTA